MTHYRDMLKQMFSDGRLYCCRECGEHFNAKVWHCRKCHHHWLASSQSCKNCHKQGRLGSPVSELVTDFSIIEVGE